MGPLTSVDTEPCSRPCWSHLGEQHWHPTDVPQLHEGTRGTLLQCSPFSAVPFWKLLFCVCKSRAKLTYRDPLDFGSSLR